MSDIAKCNGNDCDRRETCWRYLAPADPNWQAWAPFDADKRSCPHYWPINAAKGGEMTTAAPCSLHPMQTQPCAICTTGIRAAPAPDFAPPADPVDDLCARPRILCVCHRRDQRNLCATCAAADALQRLRANLAAEERGQENLRRVIADLEAERDALAAIVRTADAMYAFADHTGGNPGCNRCDAADDYLAARAKWEDKP